MISVAAATIRIATPLLLAAIGELVAERTGVYNMGLEGMMLMGALTGYLAAYESGSLWLGVLAAGFHRRADGARLRRAGDHVESGTDRHRACRQPTRRR
ncbi:MAG: hypothetical protein E5X65_33245, partial [Mesorhizobium sp.]